MVKPLVLLLFQTRENAISSDTVPLLYFSELVNRCFCRSRYHGFCPTELIPYSSQWSVSDRLVSVLALGAFSLPLLSFLISKRWPSPPPSPLFLSICACSILMMSRFTDALQLRMSKRHTGSGIESEVWFINVCLLLLVMEHAGYRSGIYPN